MSRISAKICAENGATSDGLSTDVQPVARAGNTLTEIWFSGQFHGVMSPQTPIGSLTMVVSPRSSVKLKFFSDSMAVVRWPRPSPTCGPDASPAGAPISSVTASASSPARRWYSARIAPSTSSRSSRVVTDQLANARRAALTALSTSAAEPIEMRPATCSVAGFSMSAVRGSTGSTH